jgi:hypothetical protein
MGEKTSLILLLSLYKNGGKDKKKATRHKGKGTRRTTGAIAPLGKYFEDGKNNPYSITIRFRKTID